MEQLSSRIGDAIDALHNIQSLNEVVHMAASHSGLTTDATNALQVTTTIINDHIVALELQLNAIHEELSNA